MNSCTRTGLHWSLLLLCLMVAGCGGAPSGATSAGQSQSASAQPGTQQSASEGPSDAELQSTLGEAALSNLKFNGASIPKGAAEIDHVEIVQKDTVSHGDGDHFLVKAKIIVVITRRTGDIAKAISNSNGSGLEKALAVQSLFRRTLSNGIIFNPGDEYLYIVNADLRKRGAGYEIVDGTVELASLERVGTKTVAGEASALISEQPGIGQASPPSNHQPTSLPESSAQVEKVAQRPDSDPQYISRTAARYPPQALREHHEGTVTLDILLGVDGVPNDITVAQSSGFRELDRAAMDAARTWRLTPRIKNGQLAESNLRIPINFSLASATANEANASPAFSANSANSQTLDVREQRPVESTGKPEPSFECAKAVTSTELAICSDPALRQLDSEVGDAYRRALHTSSEEQAAAIKVSQRRWIAERQKDCEGRKRCIAGYLQSRIAELRSIQ